MVRERGSGVTPPRVVELLSKAVAEKSMLAVSNATGLGLAAIGRYLKGIGEPTTATLQKLAAYFGVSVTWLRGGPTGALERLLEGLKIAGVDPDTYNKTVEERMGKPGDYWRELVAGNALLNSEHPEVLCNFFGINQYWVQTGRQPTLLNDGGIVGTIAIDLRAYAGEWLKDHAAESIADLFRKNGELRKEVEKLLAADPVDSQNN